MSSCIANDFLVDDTADLTFYSFSLFTNIINVCKNGFCSDYINQIIYDFNFYVNHYLTVMGLEFEINTYKIYFTLFIDTDNCVENAKGHVVPTVYVSNSHIDLHPSVLADVTRLDVVHLARAFELAIRFVRKLHTNVHVDSIDGVLRNIFPSYTWGDTPWKRQQYREELVPALYTNFYDYIDIRDTKSGFKAALKDVL